MQRTVHDAGVGAAAAPTRDVAFVIHLTSAIAESADQARGRVEHVTSGRAARFDSVEELLRFMRDTLATIRGERG